jgi:hypothetical protein
MLTRIRLFKQSAQTQLIVLHTIQTITYCLMITFTRYYFQNRESNKIYSQTYTNPTQVPNVMVAISYVAIKRNSDSFHSLGC